jgi:hypothetical protein
MDLSVRGNDKGADQGEIRIKFTDAAKSSIEDNQPFAKETTSTKGEDV